MRAQRQLPCPARQQGPRAVPAQPGPASSAVPLERITTDERHISELTLPSSEHQKSHNFIRRNLKLHLLLLVWKLLAEWPGEQGSSGDRRLLPEGHGRDPQPCPQTSLSPRPLAPGLPWRLRTAFCSPPPPRSGMSFKLEGGKCGRAKGRGCTQDPRSSAGHGARAAGFHSLQVSETGSRRWCPGQEGILCSRGQVQSGG